jgi:hypothetical protein
MAAEPRDAPDEELRRDKPPVKPVPSKPSLLDAGPIGPASGTPSSGRPRATGKLASTVSPMASAGPLAHASPLGAGASSLGPAAATPAYASGNPTPRPGRSASAGEMAHAAATILSGRSGHTDEESGNVRASLEESAQLARASASARARVAGLRARGASLPELDGRLAAADLLGKRGEPEAALKILEEVLVLSNALVHEFGLEGAIDIPDPMDVRIDARLSKVFERASEAARARTDELLASARLAEKVEEIARARIEELLISKRLAARIEEVASKAAIEVANNAVEALLSSDAFKQSVDARARARAEEAFSTVKSGASPEAIEAAAEKALARRDKVASGKTDRPLDPQELEQKVGPMVKSLVSAALNTEQAVLNKVRAMVKEEVARAQFGAASDADQIRKLVASEVARHQAASQDEAIDARLAEHAGAIVNSDAMKALLDEQLKVLRAVTKKDVFDDLERAAKRAKQSGSGNYPTAK